MTAATRKSAFGGWAVTLKGARQRGFADDLGNPSYVNWWLYASAEDLLRVVQDWRWQAEQAVRLRDRQVSPQWLKVKRGNVIPIAGKPVSGRA